ncbi:hypothetical protein M4S82_04660 [Planococcus sp. MERTA32b]|nr:hypothetical protein [Planococcus sp. MER TA 32b]
MEKVKIHPLILVSLLFSSISMALYAFRNFSANETAYGIVFILLSIFMMGLVFYGIVRNRRVSGKGTQES